MQLIAYGDDVALITRDTGTSLKKHSQVSLIAQDEVDYILTKNKVLNWGNMVE